MITRQVGFFAQAQSCPAGSYCLLLAKLYPTRWGYIGHNEKAFRHKCVSFLNWAAAKQQALLET